MISFKSTAKLIKPIDYEKQFILDQLFADQKMLETQIGKLRSIYPKASNAFIRHQTDLIIIKDNSFNVVMTYLVSLFEFNYDQEEIKKFKERLKTNFSDFDDAQLTDLVTKLIQKGLIFKYLADEFKIEISEQEVKDYLDRYYQSTNNPINEFLSNKEKFDEIKDVIFEEKITHWIINKFKVALSVENILKRNIPMNESDEKGN